MAERNSLKLRRVITLPRATALVVGTIIGASIFCAAVQCDESDPSVSGIIFLWLASGLLTLFGALVCAELAWAEKFMRLGPAGK